MSLPREERVRRGRGSGVTPPPLLSLEIGKVIELVIENRNLFRKGRSEERS